MGSGQAWWTHKETEMRREEARRLQRWDEFRAAHPGADLEELLVEFRRAEAVRFTLEQG